MRRSHEILTGKRMDEGAVFLFPLQHEKRGFSEEVFALSASTPSFPMSNTVLEEPFRAGSEGRAVSIYEMAIQAFKDIQASRVEMKNPGEILHHILQHPGIVDVLQTAVRTARREFPDAHFTLQIDHDPVFVNPKEETPMGRAFDWKRYLELVKSLENFQGSGFSREAVERSGVSRAYYALQ